VHANEVVRVHDSMDETIEGNGQINITIVKDVRVEPVEQKDGSVMVDVKEGKLSPFFAQHNKDGVPEIPNLGNVEQPQKISNSRVILAVSNAWSQGIPVAVRQENCFNRHVSAQHNLRNIVEELDWVRVNGRSILHDLGANNNEQNVYNCDGDRRSKICQPPTLGEAVKLAFGVGPADDSITDRCCSRYVGVHGASLLPSLSCIQMVFKETRREAP